MSNRWSIELDAHEAWMLSRSTDLSETERVHILERLSRKLPGDVARPESPDGPRDRKLDLDTATRELWESVGELDGETWRTVSTPDQKYDGHQISNFGRVVSLPVERSIELHGRRILRVYPGRLLSPAAASGGRERVCLRKDGRQKMHYIDELVWWSFREHTDDDVHHINGDPRDCRLENLKVDR